MSVYYYPKIVMYDGEVVSDDTLTRFYHYLYGKYREHPYILRLLNRSDDWTLYIAYICNCSDYLREIERATLAGVIDLVDPVMIKSGIDVFTEHVSKIIRRVEENSFILYLFREEFLVYTCYHTTALVRTLHEFTDEQLYAIHDVILYERYRNWYILRKFQPIPKHESPDYRKVYNYFVHIRNMKMPNIPPELMDKFSCEILRGHKAGVLCVDRMYDSRTMTHLMRLIKRAVRRQAALSVTPSFTFSEDFDSFEDELAYKANWRGAKHASIILGTIPNDEYNAALNHYLETNELIGTTRTLHVMLCEEKYQKTIEQYCPRLQALYEKAYIKGYFDRIELFARVMKANA